MCSSHQTEEKTTQNTSATTATTISEGLSAGIALPYKVTVASTKGEEYVAFPDVAKLPDGRLLAIYRIGTAHVGEDGSIAGNWGSPDGLVWEPQQILFDDPTINDRDPSLAVLDDGTLLITFFQHAEDQPTKTCIIRSTDGGKTFESTPTCFDNASYEWLATSSAVVQLTNGDVLLPIYGYKAPAEELEEEYWDTGYFRSSDGGKTWGTFELIVAGGPIKKQLSEPALVQLPNGKLWAFLRVAGGNQMVTFSEDQGKTWSPPVDTGVPGHAAGVILTNSGRIYVGFRYFEEQAIKRQAIQVGIQYSDDGGETWSDPIALYETPPSTRAFDCAYTSFTQLDNNQICIVYYALEGDRIEAILFDDSSLNVFQKGDLLTDRFSTLHIPAFQITPNNSQSESFELKIPNPLEESYRMELTWKNEGEWQVDPIESEVSIPSKGTTTVRFEIQQPSTIFPLPILMLPIEINGYLYHTKYMPLPIHRTVQAIPFTQPPVIDGIKDESWDKAQKINQFGTVLGKATSAEPTEFRFGYDTQALYVLAQNTDSNLQELKAEGTNRDDYVHQDDCVGMFILPPQKLESETETIYQIYSNTNPTVFDMAYTIDRETHTQMNNNPDWNCNITVAVRKTDTAWIWEARIPVETMGVAAIDPTEEWKITFRRKLPRMNTTADFLPGIGLDSTKYGTLVFEPTESDS